MRDSSKMTPAAAAEKDKDFNRPVEIYDIYLTNQDECANNDNTLHFVQSDKNIDFYCLDGHAHNYIALDISREPAETNMETQVDSTTIRLDNINKAMSAYIASHEWRGKRVVIRKVYLDYLNDPNNYISIFDGDIDDPIINEFQIQVTIVSRIGTLDFECPRRMFGLMCGFRYGTDECGVNPDSSSNKKIGAVDADCTKSVIKDSERTEADDYWKHGMVEFTSGANDGAKRLIIASKSGEFTLRRALSYTPEADDTYTIKRCCELTLNICTEEFANQDNFGGFHTIPLK